MDFGLSDEQSLFQRSLRGWLGEHAAMVRVRSVMESDDGSDRELIAGLAGQGVCGILAPESLGGCGLGLLDAVVAAEELGRVAAPYALHSAAVMAPLALVWAGTAAQQRRWLAELVTGRALLAYSHQGPAVVAGRLTGSSAFVADARRADAFVLACSEAAMSTLLLVPRDAPGLEIDDLVTVDATRRVGELMFDDVVVDETMRMKTPSWGMLERVLDAGRIALAADALGAAERALELAVEYARVRRQFGREIGSFQAVKHMCAETVAEIEPLRSLIWYAAFAWDEGYADAATTAALVKSHAAEVATRALTTCVQVYGGMGFTYECDMQVWFKRVGYDRQMLGGPAALRAVAAGLQLD